MKKLITMILLSALSTTAFAQCVGFNSLQTCYDNDGNTYIVQRFGNTTTVKGNNPQTGTTWDQTSTTIGSSTFTNGTSSDGESWNSTTNSTGDATYTTGVDSSGKSITSICNGYGCN